MIWLLPALKRWATNVSKRIRSNKKASVFLRLFYLNAVLLRGSV